MGVAVKRVYDAPSTSDGVRVLVDRLWPRGMTKKDAAIKFWLRDLAPSKELREWLHANPEAWHFFRKRYLKELGLTRGRRCAGEVTCRCDIRQEADSSLRVPQ